jgi:hypothetical protein
VYPFLDGLDVNVNGDRLPRARAESPAWPWFFPTTAQVPTVATTNSAALGVAHEQRS